MKCFHSPGYFIPLPETHPFPIRKYARVKEALEALLPKDQVSFEKVMPLPMEALLEVHDGDYLAQITHGTLPVYERNRLGLPHHLRWIERSQLDAAGTLAAANYALATKTMAWNLGGGTHHAMRGQGLGFCVTNDLAIACHAIRKQHPHLQILILDTDAHQGNGTHALLTGSTGVFCFSIHVGRNYPSQKVPGDLDCALERATTGPEYLDQLQSSLETIEQRFQPDLVFWVSGVDPHRDDRFGQLRLSHEDLLERDAIVVQWVKGLGACLAGTLSGGYQPQLEDTVALHASCVRKAWECWYHQAADQQQLSPEPIAVHETPPKPVASLPVPSA
jgi:acetoin utilization deacetylase AcuC-like enzyme